MASKNVETFRKAHQAFNRRDFDGVTAAFSPGFIYEDRSRGLTFRGRDGFREFMQGWVKAFSNAEVAEPKYMDAGDAVIAEFMGRGVNDGPLGPLPQTGRQMNAPFCEILRFDSNGVVVSGSIYYDQLSIMKQLGHIEPEAEAAAS